MRDQRPILEPVAKGHSAAQEPTAVSLIPLHLRDPLPGPVALRLGHGGEDREHQLGDAVAGHVSPEVDHVQGDAAVLGSWLWATFLFTALARAEPAAITRSLRVHERL